MREFIRCPRSACRQVVTVAEARPGQVLCCPSCGHSFPFDGEAVPTPAAAPAASADPASAGDAARATVTLPAAGTPLADPVDGGAAAIPATRTLPPDADSPAPGELAAADASLPADRAPPPDAPSARVEPGDDQANASPPPTVAAGLPARIGRFLIRARLGEGGFGVVYRAFDPQLDREVALKVAKPGRLRNAGQFERMAEEAKAAAQLRHPYIVPVFDAGRDGDHYFITAAYINGKTLSQAGPLDLRRAAHLVQQLAEALAYAHTRGIVHRDVKPANVLIDERGDPLLTDFGLAARREVVDQPVGQESQVGGTPAFMAPEQAQGRAVGASDQYSLGCTLYMLLTGRTPFLGPHQVQIFHHIRSEPAAPRTLNPRVPRDLEAVCLRCLQKDPARRYADCRALADDLRRWLDGEAVQARRAPVWERAARWARRRPAQAALAVLGLFALAGLVVGALGYASYEQRLANAQLRQAQQEIERNERRRQLDRLVLAGRQAEADGHWPDAQQHLGGVLSALDAEPALAPDDLDELRADLRARLARVLREQEAQATAQASRRRLEQFRTHHDDALFHQTLFTGLAPAANHQATRTAAAAALALFGLNGADHGPSRLGDPNYKPAEQKELAADCYELFLVWAEAEAAGGPAGAKQALVLLDRAAALGHTWGVESKAYHLRRARYLRRSGAAEAAAREEKQAGERKPALAMDWFQVGLDAYLGGRFVPALEALEEALRLRPDHFWALYVQALCQLRQGRHADAKAVLTACLGRRPDAVWPRLLRAFARTELQEYDAAAADLAQALARAADPLTRHAALVSRGVLAIRQGRRADAIADLEKAAGLKPDAFQPHANLARVHEDAGDLGAAVRAMDEAVKRQPDLAVLYHRRARLHLKRGEAAAARRDLEHAIARDKEAPPAQLAADHVALGYLLQEDRDYAGALAAYDTALRLKPDFPPAHRYRAKALLALGRDAEGGQALDRYLALGGKPTPEVHQARGLLHVKRRDYPAAVEAFTQALALRRTTAVLAQRGWAYLVLDAPRPALADFDAALVEAPGDADALSGRADARVKLGRVADGVADAEAALKRGPRTHRLLYNAVAVFAQAAGRLEAAGRADGRATWHESDRLRGRAVQLLREILDREPPGRRQRFWREQVLADKALAPLHGYHAFVHLTRTQGLAETKPVSTAR